MKEHIAMSNKEINQIELFEKLVRKEIKQKKAAKMLDLSVRQIKRKLHDYKISGAKSLIHNGRGKIGNRKIPQEKVDNSMDSIREKYWDFGPTLAHEKLVENHGCKLSLATIRKEMIAEGIWKPKRRRKVSIHQLRDPTENHPQSTSQAHGVRLMCANSRLSPLLMRLKY